jgi:3-phenylpropionate/trans-cinnamate dioxygenase ferredoxin component
VAFERVAAEAELADAQPKQVDVGGLPVCLVRLGGDVHAILDVCSHQDYPLHEGYVFGKSIECALHGSTFDLDTGRPESLPATKPVPVYPVRVEDGEVHVDVEAPLNDAPLPDHV